MLSRRLLRAHLPLATAALLTGSLAPLTGCESSDDEEAARVETLDVSEEHYGKSLEEWIDLWVEHMNMYGPPECLNPVTDTTGEACAANQTEDLPVYFLTGGFGGTYERDCAIPAGKALLFPVIATWGDNAGVPEDQVLSEEELREYVEMSDANTSLERLWARVDGVEIDSSVIDQGRVPSARYTIELPAGENAYTCSNIEGVEGEFVGYIAAFWVMLPPLPAGEHTVEFGVERGFEPVTGDSFELNVTYNLTVAE